jgi:hypothetical protein
MSSSNTPDFDNMSPEEMMRWMETLAKRQGANAEGFVTDASADVDDPTDYDEADFGPGYIPFGEEKKPAAAESKPAAAPPPAPEPESEPPVAAAPAAGGMPDFDAMSPEEAMRWMETLAKRQGANAEGFLTDASADVVDPTDYDEADFGPGYTPFGEEKKPAAESKPAAAPPPTPEPEPAVVEDDMGWLDSLTGGSNTGSGDDLPDLSDLDSLTAELGGVLEPETDNQGGDSLSWLEGLAGTQPEAAAEPPPPAPEPAASTEDFDPLSGDVDPLKWLESLAQKQGVNPEELITGGGMDIPDVDPATAKDTGPGYAGYNVDNEGSSRAVATPNPNDWLNDLAGDSAPQVFPDAEDATDPAAWLGELAGDMGDVDRVPRFDPNPDPVDDKKASTGDPIADMINRGETPPPDMMQEWMSRQMDVMLSADPLPIDEDEEATAPPADPNAPAVVADMPDWLQQMAPSGDVEPALSDEGDDEEDLGDLESLFTQSAAQAAPNDDAMPDFLTGVEADANAGGEPSPLSDEINVPDMPSWLMDDAPQGGESLDDVFAKFETSEADQQAAPVPVNTEMDPGLLERLNPEGRVENDDDPWVDALDEAPDGDFDASETLPEWYVEAMNNPDRMAEVEALTGQQLQVVELPDEDDLPRGQREPIPDWLAYATGAVAPPEATPALAVVVTPEVGADDDMPDWLVDGVDEGDQADGDLPNWLVEGGGDAVAEGDVPDWLLETIDEESEPVAVIDATPLVPVQVTPQPPAQPPRQITPQPPGRSPVQPTPDVQIDVAATLQEARQRVQGADVEGALMAYESVVRANGGLAEVVADVAGIIKADKENPAAYRVLGDALMRQGKLQAALDTYRRALNLL